MLAKRLVELSLLLDKRIGFAGTRLSVLTALAFV